MERIITISTRQSHYGMGEAAMDSITVEELISMLDRFPGDCKVVFKNDGGYTYGYVGDSDAKMEIL